MAIDHPCNKSTRSCIDQVVAFERWSLELPAHEACETDMKPWDRLKATAISHLCHNNTTMRSCMDQAVAFGG